MDDALLLARVQFAFTMVFHIVFPAFTIGLASYLALLTTTAEAFFARRGFVAVAREDVPEAVRASEEFRGACPAIAIAMVISL